MYLFYISFMCFILCGSVTDQEAVNSTGEIRDIKEDEVHRECVLHINRDFSKWNEYQPLYLIPDTNKFWLPNEKGKLSIRSNDVIELYCLDTFAITTGNINNRTAIDFQNSNNNNNNKTALNNYNDIKNMLNVTTLWPRCINGIKFSWQNETYELQQFICRQRLRFTIKPINVSCIDPHLSSHKSIDYLANLKEAELYSVGYHLNTPNERFVETMRICYDKTFLIAHYVQHELAPNSVHFQKKVKRINFGKIGHFKQWNMNHYYSKRNQYEQAKKLFNVEYEHLFNSSKGLYLTRGHLAAKTDFIYATQQRTTFTFFNIAPQWQTFNGGQWSTLENEVRKFIAKSNLHITCYTGTWGVLQLQLPLQNYNKTTFFVTESQESREFYLTMDENNNGILPVPRLYYQILIDNSSNASDHKEFNKERGIALIGVNNPHASLNEIHDAYIICKDIHDQVKWLHWIRNDNLRKGYLYACFVSDFAKKVQHLPKYLRNINKLLQ